MRSRTLSTVIERPLVETTCSHHWLIEPAIGPTSRGVCKLCGAEKEFSNIIDDSVPKNDVVALIETIGLDEDKDEGEDIIEEDAELQVCLSK